MGKTFILAKHGKIILIGVLHCSVLKDEQKMDGFKFNYNN